MSTFEERREALDRFPPGARAYCGGYGAECLVTVQEHAAVSAHAVVIFGAPDTWRLVDPTELWPLPPAEHWYRVTDDGGDGRELGVHRAESHELAVAAAERDQGPAAGNPLAVRCQCIRVNIELTIAVDGDVIDALQCVDNLLEHGVVQEPLNDHHRLDDAPDVFLHVLSAITLLQPNPHDGDRRP